MSDGYSWDPSHSDLCIMGWEYGCETSYGWWISNCFTLKYLFSKISQVCPFFVDMGLHPHEMETAQLMAHVARSEGGRAVKVRKKRREIVTPMSFYRIRAKQNKKLFFILFTCGNRDHLFVSWVLSRNPSVASSPDMVYLNINLFWSKYSISWRKSTYIEASSHSSQTC